MKEWSRISVPSQGTSTLSSTIHHSKLGAADSGPRGSNTGAPGHVPKGNSEAFPGATRARSLSLGGFSWLQHLGKPHDAERGPIEASVDLCGRHV